MIPRPSARLILLAGLANAIAAAGTAFLPGILTGPAFSNGNATGTSIVMLFVATPVLVLATWRGQSDSWRGAVVTLGALAYLAYNDVLLLFSTPFNRLFLVYVAAFGSTIFASVALILALDAAGIARRASGVPARGLAIYAWVIVTLNTLVWLRTIVPATFAERPGSFLDSGGVATNPVFVQDLSFWLPGAVIVAWLAWQRRPWGIVLIGAWLVYGLIEAVGVATDQWVGSQFDPSMADEASAGIMLFAAVAVIALVALVAYLRPGSDQPATAAGSSRLSRMPR